MRARLRMRRCTTFLAARSVSVCDSRCSKQGRTLGPPSDGGHAQRQVLESAQRIVEPPLWRRVEGERERASRQGLQHDLAFEACEQLSDAGMDAVSEADMA